MRENEEKWSELGKTRCGEVSGLRWRERVGVLIRGRRGPSGRFFLFLDDDNRHSTLSTTTTHPASKMLALGRTQLAHLLSASRSLVQLCFYLGLLVVASAHRPLVTPAPRHAHAGLWKLSPTSTHPPSMVHACRIRLEATVLGARRDELVRNCELLEPQFLHFRESYSSPPSSSYSFFAGGTLSSTFRLEFSVAGRVLST